MKTTSLISLNEIQSRINTIRGFQVMLDHDLSEFFNVETRVLNQAVKRNINRFPEPFCFRLSNEETENLKSQSVIARFADESMSSKSKSAKNKEKKLKSQIVTSDWGERRTFPYAFSQNKVLQCSQQF